MCLGGKVPSTTKLIQNWTRQSHQDALLNWKSTSHVTPTNEPGARQRSWEAGAKLPDGWQRDRVPFCPSRSASLLSYTEPLPLLKCFPSIFARLSPSHYSGLGSNVLPQSNLPCPPQCFPLRQPLYALWGTCQHRQSLAILVLVATACLLDDIVLSSHALSPGRA